MIDAILDGAQEIATPALVATLCICIVFVPIFFLGGNAYFLFSPLAMAVVFAMMASYLLSRTVVPTMVNFLEGGRKEFRSSGVAGVQEQAGVSASASHLSRHSESGGGSEARSRVVCPNS